MARPQTHEPETPMTREEFLAWVEQQPSGRFERIDGIVVAMAPEQASHNLRKGAARDALRRSVREAGLTSCQVFGDGMTVQVEDSDYEPDVLLHCGPRLPGDSTKVSDPLVRHSRMPNDQVTTQIFVSGEIGLDPPGLTVTVEEFYVD